MKKLPPVIHPNQITVQLRPKDAASYQSSDFPRPADWIPQTSLRIFVRTVEHDPSNPPPNPWLFDCCHRVGDASTATVYRANLSWRLVSGLRYPLNQSVVVKIRRKNAGDAVEGERIEDRFRSELLAINSLKSHNATKAAIPQLWHLDGTHYEHDTTLALPQNLYFCLAANHALVASNQSADELLAETVDELPFGNDPAACSGCKIYLSHAQIASRVAHCKRWRVSGVPNPKTPPDFYFPQTEALIISDVGTTLQQELREQEVEFSFDTLSRKAKGLRDLAGRMQEIHNAGWLHLDLNLDNVCLDENGNVQPIDFGQCEPVDDNEQRKLFDQRVPFRKSDFVAPEMQQRHFDIHLLVRKVTANCIIVEAQDVAGWPADWLPACDDRIYFENNLVVGKQKIWMTVKSIVRGRFARKLLLDDPEHRRSFFPNQVLRATVDRISRRESDVYAFGLVALCWIVGLQKPVIVRDELSVAKRILRKIREAREEIDEARLKSTPQNRSDEQTAIQFWCDYRDCLSYHSAIVDEACEYILKEHIKADRQARFLFLELIRIAVTCVLRQPLSASFAAIADRLDSICIRSRDKIADSEVSLPLSLRKYERSVFFENEDSQRLHQRISQDIDTMFDLWQRLKKCITDLNAHRATQVELVCKIHAHTEMIARACNEYEAEYQKLHWARRYFILPVKWALHLLDRNPPSKREGLKSVTDDVHKLLAEVWNHGNQEYVAEIARGSWKVILDRIDSAIFDYAEVSYASTVRLFHSSLNDRVRELSLANSKTRKLVEAVFIQERELLGTTELGKTLQNTLVDSRNWCNACYRLTSELKNSWAKHLRKIEMKHNEAVSRLKPADAEIAKLLFDLQKDKIHRALGDVDQLHDLLIAFSTHLSKCEPLSPNTEFTSVQEADAFLLDINRIPLVLVTVDRR